MFNLTKMRNEYLVVDVKDFGEGVVLKIRNNGDMLVYCKKKNVSCNLFEGLKDDSVKSESEYVKKLCRDYEKFGVCSYYSLKKERYEKLKEDYSKKAA